MTAPPSSRVSQKQHVRSFLTQVLCSTPSFQDAVQQDSREIDSLQKKLLAGVLSSSMAVLVSGPLLTEDTDISEEVCESQSYCPMHHQDFKVELLKFRTKSKSWTTERRKQDQTTRLMKL
ncbi:M-phase inducer phosphatase 3 isoform X2 [Calonectris borealis]|uniref:M-phase inducer phosphatase 3 isoform X2 n=1 Tax=Calonectris borealis TaxID=1323832 RepID=UPI003F4B33CD